MHSVPIIEHSYVGENEVEKLFKYWVDECRTFHNWSLVGNGVSGWLQEQMLSFHFYHDNPPFPTSSKPQK